MRNLKYSVIKALINMTDRSTVEAFINEGEFYNQSYSIMSENDAIEYACNSYSGDRYVLGCFSDWYIADNTNIPIGAVKALQKAEAFSELGELILNETSIENFLSDAINMDGIGNFVGSYDGDAEEFYIDGNLYYIWRN